VSDLTQGPQPALPPVGVDRLYADSSGNIHHLHTNGQDFILFDSNQPLGGVLTGYLPNPGPAALIDTQSFRANGSLAPSTGAGIELVYSNPTGTIQSYDRSAGAYRDATIAARTITLAPQGGDVIPNLHNISSTATAGANAIVGSWVQYPSIQITPGPGNWMLWFTAHFYAYGPFPFEVDSNVWTVSGGAIQSEVCTRQIMEITSGAYYSHTGFGFFATSGSTPITLATYIGGGALNLAPGYGNAQSRIIGFRYA